MPNQARFLHLVGCLLFGLGSVAGACADSGRAGGAAPYLRAGVGAAALGMGNAQIAAADDAGAAFWNPAALVRVTGLSGMAQTAMLGDQRSWNFLNISQNVELAPKSSMAFAVSWDNFSAGDDLEARFNNRPDPDRIFSDQENAILLSGAAQLLGGPALGVNFKVFTHALDNETGTGFGGDVAGWLPLGDVSVGLILQDPFSAITWANGNRDRLPLVIGCGAEWSVVAERLRLAVDAKQEWSFMGQGWGAGGIHAGAEYWVFPSLAVRVGFDRSRLTAGAGVKIRFSRQFQTRLDYALANDNLPGAGLTHLLTLAINAPGTRR